MRRSLLLSVLSLGCLLGASSALRAESDPRALALSKSTREAMGGDAALAAARLLRFDFQVEAPGREPSVYHHWWDRESGDYRLEGVDQDGVPYRVLFNVATREGDAWLGADRLEGEVLEQFLEKAYGRFINDSYWLLMPWKWEDPGVTLSWVGEREADGELFDVVKLEFEQVGLTPNDVYWGWVSRDTGRMGRWQYTLQQKDGSPGEAEPRTWIWEDWADVGGGLWLSRSKTRGEEGSEVTISYPTLYAASEVPPEALTPILRPPGPVAPPLEASGTAPADAGLSEVLIVLNKSDHTAALVDPETLEVVRRVPTGVAPHEGITRGRTLYVANYGAATPGNSVTEIDLPTGEVLRTVSLGEHRRPHGLALGDDGELFVTTEDSRSLLRLAAGDLSIQAVYETDQDVTHMVAVTPDGRRAFTANIGSGTVSVVDTDTGVVRSIQTGRGAEGLAVTPDGRELWVAHRSDNNIAILDTDSLETLAVLPTGTMPIRVQVTPDGNRVLVSCAMSNELWVYERWKREELARVELEEVPIGIQITPDGRRAFVANTRADRVAEIDLESYRVTSSFATGREPDGMAWGSWSETAGDR